MIAFENRFAQHLHPSREEVSRSGDLSEKCSEWEQTALEWIGDYPAYAVGIAVTIGVAIGWLLKRR